VPEFPQTHIPRMILDFVAVNDRQNIVRALDLANDRLNIWLRQLQSFFHLISNPTIQGNVKTKNAALNLSNNETAKLSFPISLQSSTHIL
jgi:hypothetical protein